MVEVVDVAAGVDVSVGTVDVVSGSVVVVVATVVVVDGMKAPAGMITTPPIGKVR